MLKEVFFNREIFSESLPEIASVFLYEREDLSDSPRW